MGGTKLGLLVLLTLAPLGLALSCWKEVNTKEWFLGILCADPNERQPDSCQWDVVDARSGMRTETTKSLPIASSDFFYCSGKFGLPLKTGVNTYRIFFRREWRDIFNFSIEDPGELSLINCPLNIREGNSVTCKCSTERRGNPSPILSWTGQTTSSTLQINYIRGSDSKTYTCEMLWGKRNKTISYKLQVRSELSVSSSTPSRRIRIFTTTGRVTSTSKTIHVVGKGVVENNVSSDLTPVIVGAVVLVAVVAAVAAGAAAAVAAPAMFAAIVC